MYNYYLTHISIIFILTCLLVFLLSVFKKKRIPRVCVLITGFAPRGLKYTHETIQKKIIDTLKLKYNTVDTYHYSFLSKNGLIDSNRPNENQAQINNDDVHLLKVNELRTDYQEDINFDKFLEKTCGLDSNHPLNLKRELYQEYMISKFPIQNYDACVLLWSDGYFLRDINIEHVENVINDNNILYTTPYNTWSGIANKFYIASPQVILLLAQRIYHIAERCHNIKGESENPECTLKWWVDECKIENRYTDMFYVKIRSNMNVNHDVSKELDEFLKKNPALYHLFEKKDDIFKLKVKSI